MRRGCATSCIPFCAGSQPVALHRPHHHSAPSHLPPPQVMVFSWSGCPFCKNAKALLDTTGAKYTALELDQMEDGKAIRAELAKMTDRTSGAAGRGGSGGAHSCALRALRRMLAIHAPMPCHGAGAPCPGQTRALAVLPPISHLTAANVSRCPPLRCHRSPQHLHCRQGRGRLQRRARRDDAPVQGRAGAHAAGSRGAVRPRGLHKAMRWETARAGLRWGVI